MSDISDGYHTFGELYAHRIALFKVLLVTHYDNAWRVEARDGWFLAGIETKFGQIRYHLPVEEWSSLDYLTTLSADREPEWDGKGSEETLSRLNSWAESMIPE